MYDWLVAKDLDTCRLTGSGQASTDALGTTTNKDIFGCFCAVSLHFVGMILKVFLKSCYIKMSVFSQLDFVIVIEAACDTQNRFTCCRLWLISILLSGMLHQIFIGHNIFPTFEYAVQ